MNTQIWVLTLKVNSVNCQVQKLLNLEGSDSMIQTDYTEPRLVSSNCAAHLQLLLWQSSVFLFAAIGDFLKNGGWGGGLPCRLKYY
jgi:hypothetical protein